MIARRLIPLLYGDGYTAAYAIVPPTTPVIADNDSTWTPKGRAGTWKPEGRNEGWTPKSRRRTWIVRD